MARKTSKRPAAAKLDLAKQHPDYYKAGKAPQLVQLKPASYLAIEGCGCPESPAFQAAIQAMYGVAFTVKMARKFAGTDYKVCHLEGLWWCECQTTDPSDPGSLWAVPRESWKWKLLIMVPDFITQSEVRNAIEQVIRKRGDETARGVKLEKIDEGLCVQILHVGPYAAELQSIARMHDLMKANALVPHGRHHEVYLCDPRRTAPEKLRTILRQPVAKSG
jgi:hypothetical protein